MQIRKMTLMLAALGALSMTLTACGDGGRESLTCTDNTGCLENEICHPTAGVCVQTCTTTADCPDSAKNCAAVSGTNAQLICKCSTPELCQRDERVADASTLTCLSGVSVCAPTGTTAGCTTNADCTGGQVCDTASGTCKAPTTGTTCQGEGKSTCNYGEFCSTGTCTAVPAPTCANFDPSKGGKTPVFNPATSTGPIIYEVTKLYFRPETTADYSTPFCGTNDVVKVRVKAYQAGNNTFPEQSSGLNGLFYVTVDGDEIAGTSQLRPSDYSVSADRKQATMNMSFCPARGSTTISLGLYFTGGNEICAQINK
jgi:hypothetical protein